MTTFEQQVAEAQQQDIQAYNDAKALGVKSSSAELMKFLRLCLILTAAKAAYDLGKKATIKTNPQTAGRITQTLGLLASGGQFPPLLDQVSVNILDKETANIVFKINDDALSNGYRRVLNQEYGLTLPEIEKEDTQKNSFDFEFIQNS